MGNFCHLVEWQNLFFGCSRDLQWLDVCFEKVISSLWDLCGRSWSRLPVVTHSTRYREWHFLPPMIWRTASIELVTFLFDNYLLLPSCPQFPRAALTTVPLVWRFADSVHCDLEFTLHYLCIPFATFCVSFFLCKVSVWEKPLGMRIRCTAANNNQRR